MMSKKTQIFMLDMIMSFVILIIAFSLIFNYYINVDENVAIYNLNKNILEGFSNTKINTLNDVEVRDMFIKDKIVNIENTVAQQVIDFYSNGEFEYSKNLTRIFVEDYLDKQMNFVITLENASIGPPTPYVLFNKTNRPEITFDDATMTSVNQRRIFTFKNSTSFYGPYLFKIKIWK